MTQTHRSPFLRGLAASLPIALGYAPIAFSFGIAATHIGLSLAQTAGLSLIVYSGAAQFMALAIFAAKTSGLADAAAQAGIWFYAAAALLSAVAAFLLTRRARRGGAG